MQESGFLEAVPLISILAIQGQFWVFLHPEFPSLCTIQAAEVADGLMVSSLFFCILSSPQATSSGWLLQWWMTLWPPQSLLNPLLKQQAAFFGLFLVHSTHQSVHIFPKETSGVHFPQVLEPLNSASSPPPPPSQIKTCFQSVQSGNSQLCETYKGFSHSRG